MAQPIHSSTLRRSSASAEKTTIAGTKMVGTTAGWTRESLSRSRDSNIGGDARRASRTALGMRLGTHAPKS